MFRFNARILLKARCVIVVKLNVSFKVIKNCYIIYAQQQQSPDIWGGCMGGAPTILYLSTLHLNFIQTESGLGLASYVIS